MSKFCADGWEIVHVEREVQGRDTVYDVWMQREVAADSAPAVHSAPFEQYTEEEAVNPDPVEGDDLVTYRMAAAALSMSPQKFAYALKKRKLRDAADFPFTKVIGGKTNTERWVAPMDEFVLWVRERFPEEIAAQAKAGASDDSEE